MQTIHQTTIRTTHQVIMQTEMQTTTHQIKMQAKMRTTNHQTAMQTEMQTITHQAIMRAETQATHQVIITKKKKGTYPVPFLMFFTVSFLPLNIEDIS